MANPETYGYTLVSCVFGVLPAVELGDVSTCEARDILWIEFLFDSETPYEFLYVCVCTERRGRVCRRLKRAARPQNCRHLTRLHYG